LTISMLVFVFSLSFAALQTPHRPFFLEKTDILAAKREVYPPPRDVLE
jgi:hypothetical protein